MTPVKNSSERSPRADFGVIGLGVMGQSLALNILDHGFSVAAWNREPEGLDRAVAASRGKLQPCAALPALVAALARPRRLLLMITAGPAVDMVLDELAGLLEPGDIVVDGGNSWFEDTQRREAAWKARGLHFVGMGVSGGEEGARRGPSLMPGGSPEAYAELAPVLEAIAARTEAGLCVTHVGTGGAGHFAKMVHNGLEYADMQLLAEAYHLLGPRGLGLEPPALADVFDGWNRGPLASFLVEISAAIFRRRDPQGAGWLIDAVMDRAEQKGTGRWTVKVALELGVAVPSIAAALDARILSSRRGERLALASSSSARPPVRLEVADVEAALQAAKISVYAQGFDLLAAGGAAFGWELDLPELARIWKGGCIIRAQSLDGLRAALERTRGSLLSDPETAVETSRLAPAWRRVVSAAAHSGVPTPSLASALAYVDALTTARLPQNLVQAQRDAFGAHTFQRLDDPAGSSHHVDWLKAEPSQ